MCFVAVVPFDVLSIVVLLLPHPGMRDKLVCTYRLHDTLSWGSHDHQKNFKRTQLIHTPMQIEIKSAFLLDRLVVCRSTFGAPFPLRDHRATSATNAHSGILSRAGWTLRGIGC